MDYERELVWGRLREAVPARWTIGRAFYDPGRNGWSISAVGPLPGRGDLPTAVTGFGEDELRAVKDLDARLRGERSDAPRRLAELRARLRFAYLEGAEEWSWRERSRQLSQDELRAVIQRFPR